MPTNKMTARLLTADLTHCQSWIPFVSRSGLLTTYRVAPAGRDQVSNFQPDAHRPTATAKAAASVDGGGSWGMWIRRPAMIAGSRKSGWFGSLAGDRRQNVSKRTEGARCTTRRPARNGRCVTRLPEAAMAIHRRPPCLIGSRGLRKGRRGCNENYRARTHPLGRQQHQCYGQQQQG